MCLCAPVLFYYLSGADRAVALIIVDVCISVSFFMQRCPATMLHTSNGKYVCLCSWPTCRHGKCGCFNFILYLSRKYLATVHSTVCPFSNCNGNLCARAPANKKKKTFRIRTMRHPYAANTLWWCEWILGTYDCI